MKSVPRFSPGFAWPELMAGIRALSAGRITNGEGASDFAAELAGYLGVRHAILVPSARMGLWLLLRALEVELGEIIFPGLTYHAMPAAAKLAGFTPRFVDVDEHLLIDVDQLAGAINERTRAIAPTHLYGRVVDMPRVMELADRYGLLVIEDIAQALGAAWQGKKAGTFGNAAIATFGPTKNITSLGGGCLFTDDDNLAERLRRGIASVRPNAGGPTLFGMTYAAAMAAACWRPMFRFVLAPLLRLARRRDKDLIGMATADPPVDFDGVPDRFFGGQVNHLMGEVGRASLAAMDARNALRRRNGLRLAGALADVDNLRVPKPREQEEPIFMSFPALVDQPEQLGARLLAQGVDTARGYMSACADLPMFDAAGKTPRAADAVAHMLHLPVHPGLSECDMDEVAATVKQVLAENRQSER